MIIPVELGKDRYEIVVERGALSRTGEIFRLDRKALIVTDEGVPSQYADAVAKRCRDYVKVTVEAGEESKNLENFKMLCQVMLENDFTRKDCVIAVGGGVIGDLAGFAASCYMRGIDFYNVPTTLLSQVDSSVGGKTAVDLCGIKNIIGSFCQPKAVLIDPDVLDTLSDRQFACGMAEAIKMAMTCDSELFQLIEECDAKNEIEDIIAGALRIKAEVVAADEKEDNLRRVLNFGHTLGHGIESVTDLYHGECVALGMIPMTAPHLRARLTALLKKEGLPVKCNAPAEEVAEKAMHDKKAQAGGIMTVRVNKIGCFHFKKAGAEELIKDYEEAFR